MKRKRRGRGTAVFNNALRAQARGLRFARVRALHLQIMELMVIPGFKQRHETLKLQRLEPSNPRTPEPRAKGNEKAFRQKNGKRLESSSGRLGGISESTTTGTSIGTSTATTKTHEHQKRLQIRPPTFLHAPRRHHESPEAQISLQARHPGTEARLAASTAVRGSSQQQAVTWLALRRLLKTPPIPSRILRNTPPFGPVSRSQNSESAGGPRPRSCRSPGGRSGGRAVLGTKRPPGTGGSLET